jgi:hypothetical protein
MLQQCYKILNLGNDVWIQPNLKMIINTLSNRSTNYGNSGIQAFNNPHIFGRFWGFCSLPPALLFSFEAQDIAALFYSDFGAHLALELIVFRQQFI